jgi:ABC-type sugar transport system ATPase subunit
MTTCDRIVVMSSGRITGDFRRTEVTEEMVVAASTVGLTDAARDTRKLAS